MTPSKVADLQSKYNVVRQIIDYKSVFLVYYLGLERFSEDTGCIDKRKKQPLSNVNKFSKSNKHCLIKVKQRSLGYLSQKHS